MTKTKKSLVNNIDQMSLFDLLSQKRDELADSRPGRLCTSSRIHAAQKAAIKKAPKSREQIADTMSDLEGKPITIDMLNNWVSDSHPHRMPGEYYSSFCIATGDIEIIRIQAETNNLHILESPDALRADLHKDVETKRAIEKRIRQKETLIKALEVAR